MGRAKNWCFTINNPVTECAGWVSVDMTYLLCGKEVGENGTPHIQGYVQMKQRKTLNQMRQYFPRAHLEVARGTPSQNIEYCSKQQSFHEHGNVLDAKKNKRGRRADWDSLKHDIDQGKGVEHVRNHHYQLFMRYRAAIIADIAAHSPVRTSKTEVYIYWGATGVGKSRKVAEDHPGAYWKTKGDWWDGYDGHSVVVIDEFYGWLPYDFMLRLCDRYPLQVPIKGGFVNFVATQIYITSNKPWNEWYPKIPDLSAFERRITRVTHFDSVNNLLSSWLVCWIIFFNDVEICSVSSLSCPSVV